MKISYSHVLPLRIRYSETDQMGFCYYGNYPVFLEVARVEMLRNLGVVYADLEKQGIILPVKSLEIDYKLPLRYDELFTIETTLTEISSCTITFSYQFFGEDQKLRTTASTTLVFTNSSTFRPCRVPEELLRLITNYAIN